MGTSKRACCSQGRRPACLPFRIWLSTRLRMKKKATDRFRRDPILLCNPTKWFVVLHHTMHDHRPVGRGKALCRACWPWPPFATHRRRAGVSGFTVSEHLLHLERQFAGGSKEEIENW